MSLKMKRWSKILLASIVGAVVGAGIYFALPNKGEKMRINQSLRMAVFIESFSKDLKPEHIDTVEEYTLLNALFSPLVIFDNDGRIQSNLASQFIWEDQNTLVFSFDHQLETIDGNRIDAQDALYSIKRMLLLNKNMHGNLAVRLEIPETFKSVEDPLPGLFVSQKKLYLRTKKKDYFILHMLASADFVVIPKNSFDHSSLEIIDFRNTSGPYYVETEDSRETLLSQNRNHFRILPGNASKIQCLKFKNRPEEAVQAFKDDKIDHIATASPLTSANYLALSSEPGASLHKTRDIMLFFASFTQHARSRFTEIERFAISNAIQNAIQSQIVHLTPHAIPTNQFFHEDGVGAIETDQLMVQKRLKLEQLESKPIDTKSLSITIEALPGAIKIFGPMLEILFLSVKFVPIDRVANRIFDSKSDLIFSSVDIGLKEDFTGISFAIEWGVFPLGKQDGKIWLEKLSTDSSSHSRAKTIEDLNLRSLIVDPSIIPLYRLPVFAVSRNHWKMNLPKLWVTERLWQIYQE